MDHSNHHHPHSHHTENTKTSSHFSLAVSATLHCLLGCGIGEVVGMIISRAMNIPMINATILSIILGFIAGMALGVLPLIKAKFSFKNALKTVVIAEGLSIAVMEAFEVLTQWAIPGVMNAQLTDLIFWIGMVASLIVGFIAALPVNLIMIKKGIRHRH
ncbi:MAG TPA: DUF4396 domain-containing protein [Bacteroidia bacterium]|nr:DUF4396 domain-containing protein [Bacteroidia bacterium]